MCGHTEQKQLVIGKINWRYEGAQNCTICAKVDYRKAVLKSLSMDTNGLLHCNDAYFDAAVKNRRNAIHQAAINSSALPKTIAQKEAEAKEFSKRFNQAMVDQFKGSGVTFNGVKL